MQRVTFPRLLKPLAAIFGAIVIVFVLLFGSFFIVRILPFPNATRTAIKETCGHFSKDSTLTSFWAEFKAAGAEGFMIGVEGKGAFSISYGDMNNPEKWNSFLEEVKASKEGEAIAHANVWPRMIAECRVKFSGDATSKGEFVVWD